MQIDQILQDWLANLDISELSNTQDILTGNTLHLVLKKTIDNYQNEFITPASTNKIINWSNLIKILQQIKITVSTQDKSQLFQGDFKTVQNILFQVKNNLERTKQNSVDLSKIDAKSDPKQTKSLLQLFVLILMRNFQINMKQSVALLSNDSKYLAHILAKGFKQQIIPVIQFLKDLQQYLPQIQQFCINKQNETFFMKSLKPGLISRFREISELSLQILLQFSLQTQNPTETMKNHLISTLVLQYRRHPGLINQICISIIKLSKYAKTLLVILTSDMNQKQFLTFSYEILSIAEQTSQLKLFYTMTKVDQLLSLCIDSLLDINNFQVSLLILLKIIETNPSMLVDDQQKLSRILNNLTKLSVNKKQSIISFINGTFTLFYILWKKNSMIAFQLYKMIILRYKNSYNEDQTSLYCYNFLTLIDEFSQSSKQMITMIIEAIVDKLQIQSQTINLIDLKVIQKVVEFNSSTNETQASSRRILKQQSQKSLQHRNKIKQNQKIYFDEQTALKVFNSLSQIFFQDVVNSMTIAYILVQIVKKYQDSPAITETTLRIVKISLAIYFANIRKLGISKSTTDGTVKIDQSNAFMKRKNLDIQFFLQQLLHLKIHDLNHNLQALLCYSYAQSNAKCHSQTIGLGKVLSILGNIASLLKKYSEDVKQIQQTKKSRIKLTPNSPSEEDSNTNIYSELTNKKKLAPGQSYSDYLGKMSKIGVDAQKGIQKYQRVFEDKKKKVVEDQIKKQQDQQRMQQIQRKLTNKILQKGIKIDPKIQSLNRYLYEFNSKQNEIKKQVIYSLSSLHIFNPAEEQINDLEGLKYILKKYNKILRVFYSQYGGKIKQNPTGTIEQYTQKQNLLPLSNVWKLFKDYELDEFMTIKQAQYLVQKLNTLKKKNYTDTNLLDFEIFEDFIVQASFTMFTRAPKDLSGYTIAGMVEETFYQFKMLAGQNKIDVRLFDDELSLVEQDSSVAALNIELKINPDYILPEGYKKVIQKKVEYYHSVASEVFENSYIDVIDVLDEIIYQKFKFHIIEPFTQIVTNIYAKSILSKKKQEHQDAKQKYFSLNVKKELFKYSGQDRKISRQVAFCLSEIVDAVEHKRKLYPKGKASSKHLGQKRKLSEEQIQKQRQKRDQQIKKNLNAQRQQKQKKRKQEEQERIKQIKKIEDQKTKKKEYQQQMKKKIEQYQQKKEIQKKKQEEQKNKQKLKEQQIYEKKRKQYLKVAKEIEQKRSLQKKINDKNENDGIKQVKKAVKSEQKKLMRVKTNPQPLKRVQNSTKKLPTKNQSKQIKPKKQVLNNKKFNLIHKS